MRSFLFVVSLVLLGTGCQGESESTPDAGPVMDVAIPMDVQGLMDVERVPDSTIAADAQGRQDVRAMGTELDTGVADVADVRSVLSDATVRLPDAEIRPDDAGSLADAAPVADAAVAPLCPQEQQGIACLFGPNSQALVGDQTLQVSLGLVHIGAGTMTPLEREQLVLGFACEGVFMPATAEAAFENIDADGVRVYRVRRVNPDGLYTWLRFYMGDTEVGYLFRLGTRELVAFVSDQDIVRCIEARGDNPPMNCADLEACLQQCGPADLDCRRPCIRATDPDAIEAYISLDECRSDCGDDDDCIGRICGDEMAECFGQ